MASTKMTSAAKQIAEDLRLRLGLTVVEGVDASLNAQLTVGTGTTGEQYAYIRLKEQASIGTDSLGIAARSYGPHVIQVVLETSLVTGATYLSGANALKLFGELAKHGAKVELYLTTNTTVPVVASITAANLVATFDSLRQPLTSTN